MGCRRSAYDRIVGTQTGSTRMLTGTGIRVQGAGFGVYARNLFGGRGL